MFDGTDSGRTLRCVLVLLIGLSSKSVLADEPRTHDDQGLATSSASGGTSLFLTVSAAHPPARALVLAGGGYDGARSSAIAELLTEVRIVGPIRVRAGGSYVAKAEELFPTVGALVGILDQASYGADAAVGVFYKPEGLTEPEGELEVLLAGSRRFDVVTVLGNVVYGQDYEGNERDVEARLATLLPLTKEFLVGSDARYRHAIGTPKGTEPRFDLLCGAVATWLPGADLALVLTAGLSHVGMQERTKTGPAALAGISRVF